MVVHFNASSRVFSSTDPSPASALTVCPPNQGSSAQDTLPRERKIRAREEVQTSPRGLVTWAVLCESFANVEPEACIADHDPPCSKGSQEVENIACLLTEDLESKACPSEQGPTNSRLTHEVDSIVCLLDNNLENEEVCASRAYDGSVSKGEISIGHGHSRDSFGTRSWSDASYSFSFDVTNDLLSTEGDSLSVEKKKLAREKRIYRLRENREKLQNSLKRGRDSAKIDTTLHSLTAHLDLSSRNIKSAQEEGGAKKVAIDDEKMREKKVRNRASVQRCRQRKATYYMQLEQNQKVLHVEQAILRKAIEEAESLLNQRQEVENETRNCLENHPESNEVMPF